MSIFIKGFCIICKICWKLYGHIEGLQELDVTHMRLETPVTNDDVNGNNEIMEYILAYTLDDDDPISYHSAIISCIKNNYV